MTPPAVDLSVVVVNWNTAGLLRECLASVLPRLGSLAAEVIVVDNASADGSADMVAKDFPGVSLVRAGENLGFARANNLALDRARGRFIFLLNPDARLEEDILPGMMSYMEAHPGVGMAGGRLILPGGRRQVGDAGHEPSPSTAFCWAFFLSRLCPGRCRGLFLSHGGGGRPVDVDWVSGAALMVRREALADAGPMPEDFFLYAEDIAWGVRFRRKGWKVSHLPGAPVRHLLAGSTSTGGAPSGSWVDSLRRYVRREKPGLPYALFVAWMAAGFLLRAILLSPLAVPGIGGDAGRRRFLIVWRALGALLRPAKT